ncbi:hypothetical protein DL764_002638 [Monosporascus ibericus]|uniref:Tachykinin family protein n=1 Tax=Monosporascus ibericus TaxID=155417 RepID=A0A4Q4TL89_9PEZI|nr:hypothetical protein DL764_002638 [Monosporascus ibericus]
MVSPQATKPGFQFITSINTIARNDETRRRVRSHARRQKLPNQTSTPSLKEEEGTQNERISKFRLGTSVSSRTRRKPPSSTENANTDVDISEATPKWETTVIGNKLAITVARELPNFSLLRIETTPLTENLLKYCMTVCLSPEEKFVEKWFDRAGAPTYMNIRKAHPSSFAFDEVDAFEFNPHIHADHSSFLATTFATNPGGDWMSSINVDNAASHAFMANVAAMHNSLANWADTTTIDFHRLQAVKSINERLNLEGKNSDTPVSDGVVVAVALLVNIESYIGSLAAAAAHMNGLKRMVELRGGLLEGFDDSSLLQRTLAWADFSYATAANKPLVFPLIPKLTMSLGLKDRFMSRSMVANTEATGLNGLSIQNREAIELFELLYSIANSINIFDWADLNNFKAERALISDSIYLLEWRLCQLEDLIRSRQHYSTRAESLPVLMPSENNETWMETSPPTDISNALIYASHLFLHLAIRGQPPAAYRHRALTEALMSSLCDTLMVLDLLSDPETHESPESHHTTSSGGQVCTENWSTATSETSEASTRGAIKSDLHESILLWILSIGSCIRMPSSPADASFMYRGILLGDHHEFFINTLTRYCRMRSIIEKETLLATLRSIVWLDRWCENQLELVWQEIGDHIRI